MRNSITGLQHRKVENHCPRPFLKRYSTCYLLEGEALTGSLRTRGCLMEKNKRENPNLWC